MNSSLDHLAIVAPDLETGCAFVTRALGVELQPGGSHPRMGTHNRLLRLGEAVYLEVIAVDPCAARPNRPRWFDLDQLPADAPARLATWAARTDDIHGINKAWRDIVGDAEPMTRGHLSWQITIPHDGSLPLDGAAPTLIQWDSPEHPARTLKDQGCSLIALDVFHFDPEKINTLLGAINFSGPVNLHALGAGATPYLIAHIQTPSGLKTLPMPSV
ncbi:VOC family protein [Pseudomonas sp. NPDC086278]|uniref:VOC family protein n=1 Tax=Pseudomonas sp. NPDC086278 TaxID=3390646 RepID=UPI003D0852C0